MFAREIYIRRRERLKAQVQSGLILLPGNDESPMNYANNTYPFRQDSSFLYYFGLDEANLAAVIDLDEGTEWVFGDDPTVEQIVWTGPLPLLRTKCEQAGVAYDTALPMGIVANEICDQARIADLVIIGHRGVNEQFSTVGDTA